MQNELFLHNFYLDFFLNYKAVKYCHSDIIIQLTESLHTFYSTNIVRKLNYINCKDAT